MLTGVKQHPNLPRRRPGKNSRKHRAAPNAGVVLFYSRVFHRAGTVKREVLVRKLGRRLTVQVSAARARLNPKVHSSVADGCERSGSQQVLVVRTAPVIQYRILRRQVRPVQIQLRVNVFRLYGDDAPVLSGGRNFWRRHVRNGRK
jgi:hypothetical protein